MNEFVTRELKEGTNVYGTKLRVDIRNSEVCINDEKHKLLIVNNDRVIDAVNKENVFIDYGSHKLESYQGQIQYYCARSIKVVNYGNQEIHLDFLVYSDKSPFPNNTVNRSFGHVNDINELEIHQVLTGRLMTTIVQPNGDKYIGIFEEGEFFEIPRGAFHCSYVLEGTCVVANIYSGAFWAGKIECKPYFDIKNNVSVEKSDDSFRIKVRENDNEVVSVDIGEHQKCGFEDYSNLLSKNEVIDLSDFKKTSIFDLLNEPLKLNKILGKTSIISGGRAND